MVDKIIVNHGWNAAGEFLAHLDKSLCHSDRKYWGRSKEGGNACTTLNFGGRKGMDALKRLHKELSDFAIERIEDNPDVYEDWPGTGQRI